MRKTVVVAFALLAHLPIVTAGNLRLTGRVTLAGVPRDSGLDQARAATACGHPVMDRSLVVDATGNLAYAVVYLEGVAGGSIDPSRVIELAIRDCNLDPPIAVMSTGQVVELKNLDPLPHRIRGIRQGEDTLFDVPLPLQNQSVRKKLRDPGKVDLECSDGHRWIRSELLVFDHPFAAVTDASGRFTIEGIPAGKYPLIVHHSRAPDLTRLVEVSADGTNDISISLPAR